MLVGWLLAALGFRSAGPCSTCVVALCGAQCKSRRNFTALTYCTSNLDKKTKRCRKKFCEHCLRKFYKEQPPPHCDKNVWKCPSCRKICCCAACRRRKLREAGAIVPNPQRMKKTTSVKHSNGYTQPHTLQTVHAPYGQPAHAGVHGPHNAQRPHTSGVQQHGGVFGGPGANPSNNRSPNLGSQLNYFPSLLQHFEDFSSEDDGSDAEPINPSDPQAQADAHAAFNQEFDLLQRVSQTPTVRKHIQYILQRTDITDNQKVETIANLLRGSV